MLCFLGLALELEFIQCLFSLVRDLFKAGFKAYVNLV